MERLLDTVFRPAFANPLLDRRHDGARLELSGPLAFTTDSYVVEPLVFPGGDIGTLAVNGTVNDLAMCGARPDFLSAGFILEEGLSHGDAPPDRRLDARSAAARGRRPRRHRRHQGRRSRQGRRALHQHRRHRPDRGDREPIEPQSVRAGDAVIVSGDLGRHGIAVMATREGLGFESAIESDCAPLVEPVLALIDAGIAVHCLRDLTRGGLASALVEIAETAGVVDRDRRAGNPGARGRPLRLRASRARPAPRRQ